MVESTAAAADWLAFEKRLANLAAHKDFSSLPADVRVRLSAGRNQLSRESQVLCFLAGANSIFFGEKLLTTANVSQDEDTELFAAMGLPLTSPG